MFGCQRFAIVRVHEQALAIDNIGSRHVGRVAAVAVRHHESSRCFGARIVEQGVDRNSTPVGIELRPLSYTVQISVKVGLRQGIESIP